MKNFLLLCLLFLLKSGIFAQIKTPQPSKINLELQQIWQNSPADKSQIRLKLAVKGDLVLIQYLSEELGGRYLFGVDGICSIELPLSALPQLAASSQVERVEAYRSKMQKLDFPDDSLVLVHNRISPAHQGIDLPRGFRGENVLIGVIDDGFDWRHPDFQRADSSSRVAYFWDQSLLQNGFAADFGYGSEWSQADIDAGLCQQQAEMHGSHVAGIAAGNGRAAGKFIGVAPEAGLLWVKIDENSPDFVMNFVDAVYWLSQKSAALGLPCSVNSSVGTYFGSHDGKDLAAQLIDRILTQRRGFALAQAAGNARQFKFHLRGELQGAGDTSLSFFQHHQQPNKSWFVLYADTAQFNQIRFNLSLVDRNNLSCKASSRYFNILDDFSLQPSNWGDTLTEIFVLNGQNQPLMARITAFQYAGTYEILFELLGANPADYWQLGAVGQGRYDIWSSTAQIGTSDMVFFPNNPPAHYQNPDSFQTIVSSWTCSERVITVGSYQNQTYMVNYGQDSVFLGTNGFPQGGISHFSSLGPTRDGRLKPDICASGGQVLSAAVVAVLYGYRNSGYPNLDAGGWHVSNRGTSMSAPLVAGALGLFLQCQPNADNAQLKTALLSSAHLDSFVFRQGNLYPNIHWGYGKLDVHKLLQACIVRGCTDTAAANYDPAANLDNGSCFYTPLYIQNLLPNAHLLLYPNPNDGQGFYYSLPELPEGAQFEFFDHLGRYMGAYLPQEKQGFVPIEGLAGQYQGLLLLQYQHQGEILGYYKLIINRNIPK